MNTKHTLAAAAAALLLGVSTAASADCTSAANLIANCGFEADSDAFIGWTVSGTDAPVQQDNFYGVESGPDPVTNISAHSGSNQAWVYDPVNALTLSQTVATTVGSNYTISFYAAQSFLDGNVVAKNSIKALFGASTLISSTNVAASGWKLYTYDVAATTASTTFSIALTDTSGEWELDDFSVTQDAVAVPETSTPLLMGAGLLALGFAARRKRQ